MLTNFQHIYYPQYSIFLLFQNRFFSKREIQFMATKVVKFNSSQIAPCGMNCGICLGYLREKNRCDGCNSNSESMPNYCKHCIIRNCEFIKKSKSGFCYDCPKYLCRRLKQLDKRYRTRYSMSMHENLNNIKSNGINEFLVNESKRWTCKTCGGAICVHRGCCLNCDKKSLKV